MNKLLLKTLEQNTRPFNDTCVAGIAKPVFENIPHYLDKVFREAILSLNENVKLTYEGFQPVSPEEELLEDSYLKARGKDPDLAKNDVVLYKFIFKYEGSIINKYIYLPFASRGNIMTVSGTPYVVSPVLTDLVISVESSKLFIRLFKDKINVNAELRNIVINEWKGENAFKPLRMIYVRMLSNNKDIIKKHMKTPLILYLLAKYGIKNTLKKYTKLEYGKDFKLIYDPEDNIGVKDNFGVNLDDYTVYSSTGSKPKGYDLSNVYQKQKVKILLRNKITESPFIDNLLSGITYALDLTNGVTESDLVECIDNSNLTDEIFCWRDLLGKTVYRSKLSVEKITGDVNNHMEQLETYLDSINREKLSSMVKVKDFWDLIAFVINVYAEFVANSKRYDANVNNFYIDLYYYICYDIIIGFNRVIKSINSRYKKINGAPQLKEVSKILNNELKQKIIFDLIKSSKCSLALSGVDYSGDSLYIKLTSSLENQNRGDGVRKGGDEKLPAANKTLKANYLLIGSLLYLGKSAPTPILKMNLWANFDLVTGKIIVPKELEETLSRLDNVLKGVKEKPANFKDFDIDEIDEEGEMDENYLEDINDDIDIDNDVEE